MQMGILKKSGEDKIAKNASKVLACFRMPIGHHTSMHGESGGRLTWGTKRAKAKTELGASIPIVTYIQTSHCLGFPSES